MKHARLFKAILSWKLDIVFDILSDLLYHASQKGCRIQKDENPLCVLVGFQNRYLGIDPMLEKLEWSNDQTLITNLLDLLEGWGGKEGTDYFKLGRDLFSLSQTWR